MFQLSLALLLVLSLSGPVWAQTASEALRGVFTEAGRVLNDPETEERPLDRLIAIEKVAGDAFDFRGAAELALGRRWQRITPAEREEFTQLFAGFLGRSVLFRMSTKAKLEGGSGMQFLGESVTGDEAFVLTSIARERGTTRVDYRMIQRDGHWKVRDVIVDGLGMTANYRAQIDRILETSSVAELLARMRERVGPGLAVAPAPATASVPAPSMPAKPAAPRAALRDDGQRPPTQSAPSAPTTLTTKAYWVHLGGLSAVGDMGRLLARVPGSTIVVTREGEGAAAKVVLTVHIGPFADADQAVSELLDLQTKGYDPYLVAERR